MDFTVHIEWEKIKINHNIIAIYGQLEDIILPSN
jgi:hypothetical protein